MPSLSEIAGVAIVAQFALAMTLVTAALFASAFMGDDADEDDGIGCCDDAIEWNHDRTTGEWIASRKETHD